MNYFDIQLICYRSPDTKMYLINICACLMVSLPVVGGSIFDSLNYYEVIDNINVFTRSKRSVDDSEEGLTREFTFHAFNRTYTCHLRPRTEIFAPGFKVSVVHSDQSEEYIHLPEGNFFEGKIVGKVNSEVHGYFEEGDSTMFTGTVLDDNELLVIEPEWRHIQERGDAKLSRRMIVYMVDDMTWLKPNLKSEASAAFCGSVHAGRSSSEDAEGKPRGFAPRSKRSTTTLNTCQLIAVADYKFYQGIGGSDLYRTASYMAGVIERVDAIYKSTVWNSQGLTGLGFEIKAMRIHDSPTTSYEGDFHYNMAKTDWEPLSLLKVFSQDLEFTNYCLAHLFTYQSFANNLLGLAYIASPSIGDVGGICSGTQTIDGVLSCPNTGLSSTRNQNGDSVLTQMADLVTAHELGHNWGSEHDPDTSECSPSSILNDGKYLMYAYSVSGSNPNNYKFSSCSRVLVNNVLQTKGDTCFKERSVQALCGNGVVDSNEGEECDAGYLGKFGLDPCCSASCRLAGDAQCSPVNHECCVNCRTASVGHVCSADSNTTCFGASYCVGDSFDCPTPPQKDDGTDCLDGGKCTDGVCEAFCEGRGKVSCVCNEVSTSCFRCCRDNATAACVPYDSVNTLPNGRPCVQGYCEQGSCKKTVQTTVERFFSIIENLTIDSIIEFFRDNLIGAVLIFSLIVWIPICIGIKIRDYKRKKDFEEDMYRVINTDRYLTYDQDGRNIKRPIMGDNSSFRELRPSDLLPPTP